MGALERQRRELGMETSSVNALQSACDYLGVVEVRAVSRNDERMYGPFTQIKLRGMNLLAVQVEVIGTTTFEKTIYLANLQRHQAEDNADATWVFFDGFDAECITADLVLPALRSAQPSLQGLEPFLRIRHLPRTRP